jgi:hypothetical protein
MNKVFLIFVLIISDYLQGQNITGSWFGQADVEISGLHSNYLTELIIKQKGDEIEGIFGYYFKDVHESFYVHGNYRARTQEIILRDIPIIYFNSNSTINSIDCNMDFVGNIFISKVKKSIIGHFYHDGKYRYTCPDLRVTYTLDIDEHKQDSLMRNSLTGKQFWKPQPDDYLVSTTETKKETMADSPVMKTVGINPDKEEDGKTIAASYVKRKNIFNKELVVESDSVELSFYDNGDIDGDSISVFLNNQLVLSHQELTAKAINIYVKLDSLKDVNEISMFAENLGTIPPNTALMVVTDGTNRYEVYMSSNLTQNSQVRLRRKKK